MSPAPDPESQTLGTEMRRFLESAIEALPESYRIVVVLRDVEGLSTAETADALEVSENTVKIRLHRARALVRRTITAQVGGDLRGAFPFLGERCDRVVAGVMSRLAFPSLPVA
jgi:RNA polymerase sigma-70 factor (ECF subfamily)